MKVHLYLYLLYLHPPVYYYFYLFPAVSPDINECELNTDGCADTHSCDNTDSSFECVPCPDGYGANADGLGCSGLLVLARSF